MVAAANRARRYLPSPTTYTDPAVVALAMFSNQVYFDARVDASLELSLDAVRYVSGGGSSSSSPESHDDSSWKLREIQFERLVRSKTLLQVPERVCFFR